MTALGRWLLVGALVLGGAALTAGRQGHGSAAAAGDPSVLESTQRVAAPDLAPGPQAQLDPAEAAATAVDLGHRIPLPAGGNFNGIQWRELEGTIDTSDVQSILEYNAACQWYRALRDGRQVPEARQIVADVPAWQATRGRETGALAAAVAEDVAAGGGAALSGVLRDCDAAHRREVAYAAASGKAGER